MKLSRCKRPNQMWLSGGLLRLENSYHKHTYIKEAHRGLKCTQTGKSPFSEYCVSYCSRVSVFGERIIRNKAASGRGHKKGRWADESGSFTILQNDIYDCVCLFLSMFITAFNTLPLFPAFLRVLEVVLPVLMFCFYPLCIFFVD